MKNNTIFQTRNCLLVCAFLSVCLLIGSFYDFQISSALYNENSVFGTALASFGQLPAMLCFSIGGVMIFQCAKTSSKVKKVIGFISQVVF